MQITKINQLSLEIEETIAASTLSNSDELVFLLSSGNVIRYKISEQNAQYLFSVNSSITYSNGGFDCAAKTSIYTMDSIVVVVNDYKLHALIHYPQKYNTLRIQREDYHADISCYPIALFKDEKDVPHLIYGVAWNHIQIMNLDTRQIVTASKSLIEEGAEEHHIEYYKNHKEDNKFPWPTPYDYFFGKLFISPNQKEVLSAGWAWGSSDYYTVYNIQQFIESNRITKTVVDGWEHYNRAVCWIDNETIAVTFNPYQERYDDSVPVDSPHEIHFYKFINGSINLERQVKVEGLDISNVKMYFNKQRNALLLFSDKVGLAIVSLSGESLFLDSTLLLDNYFSDTQLFIKTEGQCVSIYQMSE
jgi:hypothetical protein